MLKKHMAMLEFRTAWCFLVRLVRRWRTLRCNRRAAAGACGHVEASARNDRSAAVPFVDLDLCQAFYARTQIGNVFAAAR